MTDSSRVVIAGVDTHRDTVHVGVIDADGRQLGDAEFPTTPGGYRGLLGFCRGLGRLERVGVEGTGAYGAALALFLRERGLAVIEVDRPDRRARRRLGKSDPIDAYAAADAVRSARAATVPKSHDGPVEVIRMLHLTRRSAIKARTQTMNQLRALLVTAPAAVREQLRGLGPAALIKTCAALRPGANLLDPTQGSKAALRRLAGRHQVLTREIDEAFGELETLIKSVAPDLLDRPGVGPDSAARLLITAGDNPERLHSEAAFAHLCAAAPIPASTGRTHRHRLNRGGDRSANSALHIVAINRLRVDPATRAYLERRTKEGLSKREILRCLKRYIARELYHLITKATVPNQAAQTAA